MASRDENSDHRLRGVRLWAAILWFGALFAAAIVSNATNELRPCTTTRVATMPGSSTETSVDPVGASSQKQTDTRPSKQTTSECGPISVAMLAAGALPGLALLRPILKGFNVAGLFGLDFKEVTEKAAKAAGEQTIRLIVAREAVAKAELSSGVVEGRDVEDFPTE